MISGSVLFFEYCTFLSPVLELQGSFFQDLFCSICSCGCSSKMASTTLGGEGKILRISHCLTSGAVGVKPSNKLPNL